MFSYTKACSLDRLEKEIRESDILIALDRLEANETTTFVFFKGTISSEEETILDQIIDSHIAIPLPQNEARIVTISEKDQESGGVKFSPKFAPDGWGQVYHELEFKTSVINSIHERDENNQDLGWSSLKFLNEANEELLTQEDIDAECVWTVLDWMPNKDYAIRSGVIAQLETPSVPVYIWAIGVPDLAPKVFAQGGMNLQYVNPRTLVGLDGVSATVLYYEHPILGPGAGTNKIRFKVRHPAGFKHRLQAIFEVFMS